MQVSNMGERGKSGILIFGDSNMGERGKSGILIFGDITIPQEETAIDAKCVSDGTDGNVAGMLFAGVVQHDLTVLHKPGALAPGGGGESVNADP